MQPDLPRPVELTAPQWWVVSNARITNPCIKRVQDDGSMKRPKSCLKEDTENPEWPEGYTYLDQFLDEMKEREGMSNELYKLISQEVSKYEKAAFEN